MAGCAQCGYTVKEPPLLLKMTFSLKLQHVQRLHGTEINVGVRMSLVFSFPDGVSHSAFHPSQPHVCCSSSGWKHHLHTERHHTDRRMPRRGECKNTQMLLISTMDLNTFGKHRVTVFPPTLAIWCFLGPFHVSWLHQPSWWWTKLLQPAQPADRWVQTPESCGCINHDSFISNWFLWSWLCVLASGLNLSPGFMELTNEWACLGVGLSTCSAKFEYWVHNFTAFGSVH